MGNMKLFWEDALDILRFDGAVQDTLAELRRKWGAQVPALLDERFDAVGVQYMRLPHEKGAVVPDIHAAGKGCRTGDGIPVASSRHGDLHVPVDPVVNDIIPHNAGHSHDDNGGRRSISVIVHINLDADRVLSHI